MQHFSLTEGFDGVRSSMSVTPKLRGAEFFKLIEYCNKLRSLEN